MPFSHVFSSHQTVLLLFVADGGLSRQLVVRLKGVSLLRPFGLECLYFLGSRQDLGSSLVFPVSSALLEWFLQTCLVFDGGFLGIDFCCDFLLDFSGVLLFRIRTRDLLVETFACSE